MLVFGDTPTCLSSTSSDFDEKIAAITVSHNQGLLFSQLIPIEIAAKFDILLG